MTTETTLSSYVCAVEVRRSDTGTYEIPGAAEVEDWHEARTALGPHDMEDYGELGGWGPWERVVHVTDADGRERWYFVASEWPEGS
jgi:hypothetical protein